MSGLITFSLAGRDYATPLAGVREVVRLRGLTDLPGLRPPMVGVLDVRGVVLPVLDLRAERTGTGDVLVLERDGLVGVAVDRVQAVVTSLPAAGTASPHELPAYVRDVLRGPAGTVFLVDLAEMVEAVR